jgi:alpha-1,2-mannosyltransferase
MMSKAETLVAASTPDHARGWTAAMWLDRRRLGIGAALLLCIELLLLAFFVAGTHGWIVPLDRPTTTDFASFYAAGALADAGTPQLAYDHAAHLAAEEAATAPGIEYQFFNYPPVFLLICTALATMPYLVAFSMFMAATLAAYLFVARRILDDRSGTALLVLLAFPIVFWTIGLGQNAFLTAALFGAATLLVDLRPILAGLLFGALCYKPHFGLLVPLALAAGGRWRCFTATAASACGLALASLLVFGSGTWSAFLMTAAGSHAVYESGRILFAGMVSPFGAVRLLGGSVVLAYAVQAVASLTAASFVVVVWRRGLSLPTRAAVLVSATLLALPLALLYDLMLGAVAAVWLVRDRRSAAARAWEGPVLAGLSLLLLDGRYLAESWHVPVFPLAALALFAMAVGRAVREWQQQTGSAVGYSRRSQASP